MVFNSQQELPIIDIFDKASQPCTKPQIRLFTREKTLLHLKAGVNGEKWGIKKPV